MHKDDSIRELGYSGAEHADDAQKLFDGEGSRGGDGLLLSGSRSTHFTLTIATHQRTKQHAIEYTVLIPTDYVDGRHVLLNPSRKP